MTKFFICLFVGALVTGGTYYFTQNRHDTAWWENERDRLDLQHQIQLTQFRVEKLHVGPDAGKLAKAVAEKAALEQTMSVLREKRLQLAAEIVNEEQAFLGFREERLGHLRERAIGKEWTEFVSSSGRVLVEAKVIHIDDSGVMFRHRDGSSRMRYQDLSDDQRCLFGLEETASVAAMKEERERAVAYEKWISRELDAIELERSRNADYLAIYPTGPSREPVTMTKAYSSVNALLAAKARQANVNASLLRSTSLSAPARRISRRQGGSYYNVVNSGCGTATYYPSKPRFFSARGEIRPYSAPAPPRSAPSNTVTPASTPLPSTIKP